MASEQFQRIRDRNLTPSQVIHEVHMANALGQLTDDEAEEILVHYGIKGMRWGVRRPVGTDGLVGGPGTGSGGSSRAKKAASATGRGVSRGLADAIGWRVLSDVTEAHGERLNKKYYSKLNAKSSRADEVRAMDAYAKEFNKLLTDALEKSPEIRKDGTAKFTAVRRPNLDKGDDIDTFFFDIRRDPIHVKHADMGSYFFSIQYTIDSDGIHVIPVKEELSQADSTEAFLVHYGIKGMRWGVRRPVGTDGLVGGSSRAKKAVKATGRGVKKLTGRDKKKESQSRDTRSDKEKRESNLTGMTTKQLQDRINRLELEKRYKSLSVELKPPAPKQTKTKGVKVRNLTDVELRAYVDRLNLEKQYSQLTTPPAAQKKQKQKSAVRKFLVEIGGKQLKRQSNAVLNAKIDPIVADIFKLTADAQKKAAEEDKKK